MLRRDFLQHLVVLSTGLTAGCGRIAPAIPGFGQRLIDAHCHLFNASDLPVVRFLRHVVLKLYPEQAEVKIAGDVRDKDLVDRLIELAVDWLEIDRAPTADQEIAFLQGRGGRIESARSYEKSRKATIEQTSRFLVEIDRRSRATLQTSEQKGSNDSESQEAASDRAFLDLFVGAQGKTARMDVGPMSMTDARASTTTAFDILPIGRYLEWFTLLRLYRHVLVDRLASDIANQGFKAELVTPALVDYDEWLFEDVIGSPLPRQMVGMDLVSRRRAGPAVHGYMGFDPLREVAFDAKAKGATVSSMATVRTALLEHGFIGAKLYPPMGFRAWGNVGPYPKRTLKRLGLKSSSQLNEKLNRALDEFYQLCVDLDAPILTHAYASNFADKAYEFHGDPAYWIPVFKAHRELRVCLGHFGPFDKVSNGRDEHRMPESSWEWRVGEFIRDNPQQRVFVDISYFSEVLTAGDKERDYFTKSFKRWATEFDPNLDHVLFGTDWIMIGQERGYKQYVQSINAFLREGCGFGDEACEKIFRLNAMRFLPLERDARGRQRLLDWYARNNIDPSRLPAP